MADTTNKYNFLDYEGLSLFWNNVKKVIGDNELVTATALTNLDTRVNTVEDFLSNQIISISYTDLKTLRDNAQLVPGQQYRITDYQCTTVQENTRALGHAFDIIVTADDASTINEVARAVKHDGDTYFAGCDLNVWKIWYCLDNDTTRFAWADSVNGKGVIYRMIDEFDNDIPYDFKNIQFKHPNDTTTYPHYYYTFASDNIEDNTDCSLDISSMCYSNTIRNNLSMEGINESPMMLNQIIFIGAFCFCNSFGNLCSNNSFGGGCISNSFGIACSNNAFGSNCSDNTFGDICIDNTFGGDFTCNTFGNECQSNTFGDTCQYNTLGNECQYNTFGNECKYNTFGDRCQSNTFGGDCCRNIFGPYCQNNTFGSSCYYNTFGDGCQYNSFGDSCNGNTFGNNCQYIKFASDSSATTKYNYYRNNHFGDGCQYIVFTGAETASASAQVQNYKFAQGLQGTSDEYLAIDGKRNRSYETYISIDTDGTIKESVIADKLDKIIETTYANLVSLRESSNLIPGQQYRITDYTCTTTTKGTKSAGHVFDIIVTANDESTLNEVASVAKHNGDEYFANSDLNAWQIWYCLDNDTSRFNWADTTNGKGVIYRMIDEWNNDVPYDFKNIQFYRQYDSTTSLWSTIPSDNTGVPCYTFSSAGSSSTTSFTDMSLSASNYIYHNIIKKYISSGVQILNNNCFFGDGCNNNCFGQSCYNNTLGRYSHDNTFGNSCNSNNLNEYCFHNTFGSGCNSNNLNYYCNSNFFGDSCTSNSFDKYCNSNSMGIDCSRNRFYMSCNSNNLGNSCSENTIDGYCNSNSLGNNCQKNSIGQSSYSNTFGTNGYRNSIGKYCYNNTFGDNTSYNTFGDNSSYNSIGNYSSSNKFGNYFCKNSLGNNCEYIHSSDSDSDTTIFNYYQYNYFGDGCRYILLKGVETASSSAQVQNYNFAQGTSGKSGAYLTIDGKRNRSYETYISIDTNGVVKEFVIADKLDKIIEISHGNLVTLRDSSKLIPGQQYRITDYQCTTIQENTRSANHQFDIIVTADDEGTLNEVARAVKHDGDTYFTNNDLSAWQIWYCLDNDTTRFYWADSTNGKGVIYRMVDEWNNDIPYDFKNIQFKHPNNTTTYPYYYYTFASNNVEANTDYSLSISNGCYSNVIKEYVSFSKRELNNIVFIGGDCYSNIFGNNNYNNSFEHDCYFNSFGDKCDSNNFGRYCRRNTFESECSSNSFISNCDDSYFGSKFYGNTLGKACACNYFMSGCNNNKLGENCSNNFFNTGCYSNSFDNSCYSNSLGINCTGIKFGKYCSGNSIGNRCIYIVFASNKNATTKYNYYQNNHFGDECQYILFKGAETASDSAQVQNYNFAQGLQGTSSEYLTIDGVRNLSYETKVAKNSKGEIKIYCEADLIQ